VTLNKLQFTYPVAGQASLVPFKKTEDECRLHAETVE